MSKVHLYKREGKSQYWQALVYLRGKRYRFSCHTTDRGTARKYAHRRISELSSRLDRGLTALPVRTPISRVFERYERQYLLKLRASAQKRMMDVVGQARTWFSGSTIGDPALQEVTASHIQAFLQVKRSEGVTPRTVNLYRANLHRVFQLCVRPWMLIPSNPVDGTEPLRHDPREPELLSEAEYGTLRAACEGVPMLKLFVRLAWETGARTGELLQLTWDDVDFEQRLLTLANEPGEGRKTKGRRSRVIPLSRTAAGCLKDHAASYRLTLPRSPWVFKHLRRHHGADAGDRLESVYDQFKHAAKGVGLPTLRQGQPNSLPQPPRSACATGQSLH